MFNLIGAQPIVLQAILDSQGDSLGYIEDGWIAKTTGIALNEVRCWLKTLEEEDLIEVAKTESGLRASINAKGRLALSEASPPPTVQVERPDPDRVLLVISSPLDDIAPMDLGWEVEEVLRTAFWQTRVSAELIRVNPPTFKQFHTIMAHSRIEVVHFRCNIKENYFLLEKPDGSGHKISVSEASKIFEGRKIKLVVANTCDNSEILGASLAKHVPAVVVTAGRIGTETAELNEKLYSSLAQGQCPRDAVKAVNQGLRESGRDPLLRVFGRGADKPVFRDSCRGELSYSEDIKVQLPGYLGTDLRKQTLRTVRGVPRRL